MHHVSQVSQNWLHDIDHLADFLGSEMNVDVRGIRPAGGSTADQTFVAETGERKLFLKLGSGEAGKRIAAEANGLHLLRAASHPLTVPEVLLCAQVPSEETGETMLLATEFLERVTPDATFERIFAEGLAAMHQWTPPEKRYGFPDDNYIGLGRQPGGQSALWHRFFLESRLDPMVAVARETGRWRAKWDQPYALLCGRIAEILPANPGVSIVHGDLWSGNVIALEGAAAIIDPAVYYGHGEVDLAMTELFGGFSSAFYSRYQEVLRIASGYEDRREVYNLYHIINHLNIFGDAYASRVATVLERFA